MRSLSSFFILEFKRAFGKRKIVLFLLFLVLSLYFVQEGIGDYKKMIADKGRFLETEKLNIDKFINYSQYGYYGFRLKFIPSPMSIFLANSGVVSELTAFVDSGVRLRIYNSFLGKNLYVERAGGFKDFVGILLLLGSLFSLFYGYDCFYHRDYLKFLSSILDFKKVFLAAAAARLLLITLFLFLTQCCALLLVAVNGLTLSTGEYGLLAVHFSLLLLLFIFFFALGILAGTTRSRHLGMGLVIALWFVFIFLLPGAVNKIVAKKADNITSAYNLEQKKLKVLTDFESKAVDEAQRYTSMQERRKSERKLIESYWSDEFKKIQAYENEMQAGMRSNLEYFQQLSLMFPSTFYLSVNNEMSSKGYESFFDFYVYIQDLQQKFVRFYFNKKFYSNYKKIEPFVKAEENVFHAESRLHGYFIVGLTVTLFYVLLLSVASYVRFKKVLFVQTDEADPDPNKLNLELNPGESVVLLTTAQSIINRLYNVFSGIGGEFKGKVRLKDRDIVSGQDGQKENFVYLCQAEKIPGSIKAGDFARFLEKLLGVPGSTMQGFLKKLADKDLFKKNFVDLKESDKAGILFAAAQLKDADIFMIHDFVKGMPLDFIMTFKEQVKGLKEKGAAILYLSNDVLLATKIGDRVTYLLNDPSLPTYMDNYSAL